MTDFKGLVDEMKSKGIETALIKRDGGVIYSNFSLEDPAPFISQCLVNNAYFLMKELGNDELKDIELTLEGKLMLLVPMKNYILIALVKNKEDKKVFRDYTSTIRDSFFES